ncbi:MAG TPA: glutathione S-transferase family protein [Gallionella sp.]|nr:glutathione S-transferase family protein [Gallionella sp.]
MYELFIANKNYSSWSLRPWVLMRELSIPFAESLIPFGKVSGKPTIADVSPSGRVPCLRDGQLLVWDSLAIAEYLAERHAQVWPSDVAARAWARSAAAEMHSGFFELRSRCPMNCGVRIRLGEASPSLAMELERLDALWQEGLARFGGPFLTGARFTAVDAFYAPVAFRVQTYGLQLAPEAMSYVSRLLQLASMQEWLAAALQEPWRDEAHEAEARSAGMLIEDRRVAVRG